MGNTQNNFGIKMSKRILALYVNESIIMKRFVAEAKKSEAFKHSTYEEAWCNSISESIYCIPLPVTYDISDSHYLEKHTIKILLWDVNAFTEKIESPLKIEETKLRTINLILINKIKEYIVKLSIANQLLFSSFDNML